MLLNWKWTNNIVWASIHSKKCTLNNIGSWYVGNLSSVYHTIAKHDAWSKRQNWRRELSEAVGKASAYEDEGSEASNHDVFFSYDSSSRVEYNDNVTRTAMDLIWRIWYDWCSLFTRVGTTMKSKMLKLVIILWSQPHNRCRHRSF